MTLLSTLYVIPFFLFAAGTQHFADSIYHNATILTIDDTQPKAEAVAVKDGKILAVGTKEEVLKTKNRSTKMIDIQGRTIQKINRNSLQNGDFLKLENLVSNFSYY